MFSLRWSYLEDRLLGFYCEAFVFGGFVIYNKNVSFSDSLRFKGADF